MPYYSNKNETKPTQKAFFQRNDVISVIVWYTRLHRLLFFQLFVVVWDEKCTLYNYTIYIYMFVLMYMVIQKDLHETSVNVLFSTLFSCFFFSFTRANHNPKNWLWILCIKLSSKLYCSSILILGCAYKLWCLWKVILDFTLRHRRTPFPQIKSLSRSYLDLT